MAYVNIAYARAHLSELLAHVTEGERILILRDNTPVAELAPPPFQHKFSTGKGRAMIIDPGAFDHMTDDEAGACTEFRLPRSAP